MEAKTDMSQYWMSHNHCVLNDPVVIAMHVFGDLATALAYTIIPLGIVWTSWKYRLTHTRELRAVLLHGAAFIVACGATHVLEAWNWWNTDYMLAGWVKIFCGIVSITFAWKLWRYLEKHPLRSNGDLSKDEWFGEPPS